MIKAIIFDLDNCILDTHSLGEAILAPVLAPLCASALPEKMKDGMASALWDTAFEDAIAQNHVPDDVAELMRVECRKLTIPEDRKIKSYGDEWCIQEFSVKKFLVTSGYRNFQNSKIAKLGIRTLFDQIIIDEMDDPSVRKKKKRIFEEILEENNFKKEEVLVVGDNPRSELRAAKDLGIKAIQTVRPGIQAWDEADHHIKSLSELSALIT